MAEKVFNDTKEAFKFFIDNIYQNLLREEKQKIKVAVHYFKTKEKPVSETKLEEIMEKYGKAEIETKKKIKFSID